MGSFGYIAGGALAGGGKAVEQFAAENMAELRMQKIEELRAQHQSQMQQSGQQFEHAERETAYGREVQAASLGRQFQQEQQGRLFKHQTELARESEASRTHNIELLVQGKKDVQGMKNAGANKPKPPGKDWTSHEYVQPNAMFKDPKGNITFGPKSTSIMHHASGENLIEVNGRLIHFDGQIEDYEGDKGALRASAYANAKQADVDNLIRNPGDWSAFYQAHNYLPAQWQSAYTAYYDNLQRQYHAQGGSTTANEPDEPEYDPAVQEALRPSTAPGGGGYDTSYANTGDRGPQATDTAPAQ